MPFDLRGDPISVVGAECRTLSCGMLAHLVRSGFVLPDSWHGPQAPKGTATGNQPAA